MLLTSAAVLVLEILVSRLVAPCVGLTLETCTAAIGVALGAIAAGASAGGRLADTADPRRWLGLATAAGGALVLTARPLVFAVGDVFRGLGPVGTLVLVLLAVAPAALVTRTSSRTTTPRSTSSWPPTPTAHLSPCAERHRVVGSPRVSPTGCGRSPSAVG